MKNNAELNRAEQMILRAAYDCIVKSEFIDHDTAVAKFDAFVEMAIALEQTTEADVEKIKDLARKQCKGHKKG